jgi:hypothetical protein
MGVCRFTFKRQAACLIESLTFPHAGLLCRKFESAASPKSVVRRIQVTSVRHPAPALQNGQAKKDK